MGHFLLATCHGMRSTKNGESKKKVSQLADNVQTNKVRHISSGSYWLPSMVLVCFIDLLTVDGKLAALLKKQPLEQGGLNGQFSKTMHRWSSCAENAKWSMIFVCHSSKFLWTRKSRALMVDLLCAHFSSYGIHYTEVDSTHINRCSSGTAPPSSIAQLPQAITKEQRVL